MLGRLRILDRQLAEQCRGSLGSLTLLQMLPNLRVGAREGDVVDGRTGVQAGIGRMPRDLRSAMVSRAICWNLATDIVSLGSITSSR